LVQNGFQFATRANLRAAPTSVIDIDRGCRLGENPGVHGGSRNFWSLLKNWAIFKNRKSISVRILEEANMYFRIIVAALALVCACHSASPQSASGGPVDPTVIENLVAASRILADQGVVDAFGHVSIRHPTNPNRYLMSRAVAPALVTTDDIMEFDLESNPIDQHGRGMFIERFIHGEIYKMRPDVNAVVHSHSPAVIPFGVTQVPMRPLMHTGSFLYVGVPVWEIRDAGGATDMLVRTGALGKSLAERLGDKPVALMRGHGDVVVGPTVQLAVVRAIYTEIDARLQAIAISLGGPINYISPEEGALREKASGDYGRAWDLWKAKAMGK
jgi:ribulose-5-phosphate 4-epimerase/fuculose-1-phosphate aldolase